VWVGSGVEHGRDAHQVLPGIGGVNALIQRFRCRLPRRNRVGYEMAQTLTVASQMALLCPSGMDVWMQRELTGCTDLDRFDSRRVG